MTDRSFERANDESRERLARLAAALTPSQLQIDLGEGWTVASALAHTGFWDRWQGDRWAAMLDGSWTAESESVLAAEELANEALHPYWAGLADPNVAAIAVEAATRLDALIASAPDAIVDSLEGTPIAFLLHRHNHRGDHLDHIERSIAAAAASTADRSFIEKNAASRRRMAAVVERLRAEDLSLATEPTDEGSWTVAQSLGHLLFWDRSMETRWKLALERAGDTGPVDIVGIPMEMTDAINLPLAGLIDAWTERLGLDIGVQGLAAAEAVDALVEECVDRLPAGALAARPNAANRWSHRDSHLEGVERALAASRAAAPADRGYLARNEMSRAALRESLDGLSATDLARPVGDGSWTTGQVLGHMAFWDRFLASRWRAALAVGTGGQPSMLPHELADLLNDGLPPTWQAFASASGAAAIAEVAAAAEEVDRIIATLPSDTPVGSILGQRPALLDRSIHRYEHLAALKAAMTGKAG